MVVDIAPGYADGPFEGTLVPALGGTQLLFAATDSQNGLQLWLSDGTAAHTQKVTTFGGPGYGAVSVSDFFSVGVRTFFACDDGVSGKEPWVFDPSTGTVAFVLPYGSGCAGTPGTPQIGAVGLPTIGNNTFQLTVANALPLTFAIPIGSGASNNILVGGGCHLLVDLPFVILSAVLVDAVGAGAMPLPIPNDPGLIGASLFFQWATLDALGPFLGDFAFSRGLQTRLGV
jgi:ELWxxDGT repeat protein